MWNLPRRAGVKRLARVSGIGSDAALSSLHIFANVAKANSRSAQYFSRGHTHSAGGNVSAWMTHFSPPSLNCAQFPIYPMFGSRIDGTANVDEVAEAIKRALRTNAITYGCGPRTHAYEEFPQSRCAQRWSNTYSDFQCHLQRFGMPHRGCGRDGAVPVITAW
jgi:hypothetical protein